MSIVRFIFFWCLFTLLIRIGLPLFFTQFWLKSTQEKPSLNGKQCERKSQKGVLLCYWFSCRVSLFTHLTHCCEPVVFLGIIYCIFWLLWVLYLFICRLFWVEIVQFEIDIEFIQDVACKRWQIICDDAPWSFFGNARCLFFFKL